MPSTLSSIGHRLPALLLICLASLGLTGCKGDPDKVVFRFGHLGNEDHIWHHAALEFARLVETRSGGRLEIKVYPNEQLGKELDMINGIRSGVVDMTITGESLQNWTPVAGLCAVPYAIRDSEHLTRVVEGPVGGAISAAILERVGLRPLAWFERGARNLTSNRPIRHPDDLKGIILRVPNVPLFVKTWQALGAKPTPMAFSEVFTSLQQGTVHAQENPFALILSAGFPEVQKYCNLTEHVIGWVYVVIGEAQFQALPDDLKEVLTEAALEMQTIHRRLFKETQQQLIEALKERGMILVETDREAFKARAEAAVLKALTEEQRELYRQIVEME